MSISSSLSRRGGPGGGGGGGPGREMVGSSFLGGGDDRIGGGGGRDANLGKVRGTVFLLAPGIDIAAVELQAVAAVASGAGTEYGSPTGALSTHLRRPPGAWSRVLVLPDASGGAEGDFFTAVG